MAASWREELTCSGYFIIENRTSMLESTAASRKALDMRSAGVSMDWLRPGHRK